LEFGREKEKKGEGEGAGRQHFSRKAGAKFALFSIKGQEKEGNKSKGGQGKSAESPKKIVNKAKATNTTLTRLASHFFSARRGGKAGSQKKTGDEGDEHTTKNIFARAPFRENQKRNWSSIFKGRVSPARV